MPTSLDIVNFDSASNASDYTLTVDVTARCNALQVYGPASGSVTFAGTAALLIHGNTWINSSGVSWAFTGPITLSSSSGGNQFSTNGNSLGSSVAVNGFGCGWVLGGALTTSSLINVIAGSFSTNGYAVSASALSSSTYNPRSISLFSSAVALSQGSTSLHFGTSTPGNLSFDAGTSTLTIGQNLNAFYGNGKTFYNVTFSNGAANTTATIYGANTFNALSTANQTVTGVRTFKFAADQTIGSLLIGSSTNATTRFFFQSDTIGAQRTLTCSSVSALSDVDFQDISIAGAAAPVSGTRLGDVKGNSGITFDPPKTVYWGSAGGGNWGGSGWSTSVGGGATLANFPLAQDTAVFPAGAYPTSGQTVTLNSAYNIGSIDMSARTSDAMTLATGSITPIICGNWINGTGTTLTGTGTLTFAGRGSQTITSAGKTFTQPLTINTPNGSVTLQDAFTGTNTGVNTINLFAGTFDANGYNVTVTSFGGSVTTARTAAIGSGTWTLTGIGSQTWNFSTSTNLTVTGTGTISLINASAKTFAGGGISYSDITLNQGGAGALTITGNNTFKDITNSYSSAGATTIAFGTTLQYLAGFSASGSSGKLLSLTGSSTVTPATLVYTGSGVASNSSYLSVTNVRVAGGTNAWTANNSVNNASLGWIFTAAAAMATGLFLFFF